MPREPKRRALLHPKDIASLSDEHAMHYHNTLVIVEKLDLLLKQRSVSHPLSSNLRLMMQVMQVLITTLSETLPRIWKQLPRSTYQSPASVASR